MNPERKHPVLAAIDYARALANHRPPPGLPIAWVSSDLKRRLQSDPTSPYYRPDLYPDPNHDRNPTMNADVAADVISIVKCSKCGKHFEKNDYGCPFCALNFTEDQLNAAMARLPAGMEHCTILFKECAKGHGRLTATNWIDHGCSTCKIQELEAKLKQAGELKPPDDTAAIEELHEACREIISFTQVWDSEPKSNLCRECWAEAIDDIIAAAVKAKDAYKS